MNNTSFEIGANSSISHSPAGFAGLQPEQPVFGVRLQVLRDPRARAGRPLSLAEFRALPYFGALRRSRLRQRLLAGAGLCLRRRLGSGRCRHLSGLHAVGRLRHGKRKGDKVRTATVTEAITTIPISCIYAVFEKVVVKQILQQQDSSVVSHPYFQEGSRSDCPLHLNAKYPALPDHVAAEPATSSVDGPLLRGLAQAGTGGQGGGRNHSGLYLATISTSSDGVDCRERRRISRVSALRSTGPRRWDKILS